MARPERRFAQVYEAILPLLRDADLDVGNISLTPEQAREKMEKGLPLLPGLELDLDAEAVRGLMLRLAAAAEQKKRQHGLLRLLKAPEGAAAAARRIRLAFEAKGLDIAALLPHIAAGENGPVLEAAKGPGLDPGLLWLLAQNALKPALRAWCRQLTPLAKGIPWGKGICFVCGAALPAPGPLLG